MVETPKLTLRRSLVIAAVSCILLLLTATIGFLWFRSDALLDRYLDDAVSFRTEVVAQDLGRTLHADWVELEHLAQKLGANEPRALQGFMDGMRSSSGRITWVGYADISGTVLAASDGILLGQNVSSRPLFKGGLRGGFAGDVQDATMLTQAFGIRQDQPLKIIGLSRPVFNQTGEVQGVVSAVLNADWLFQHLAESARIMKLDILLLGPNGSISASSTAGGLNPENLQIFRKAQAGTASAMRETWPDGKEYFSSLIVDTSYGTLPSFGWRMIGRVAPNTVFHGLNRIITELALVLTAALLGFLAIAYLYYRIILHPISRLGEGAFRVVYGEELPARAGTTLEASRLAAALLAKH